MKVIFGDKDSDFARYFYESDNEFIMAAENLFSLVGMEELERQKSCVTSLLPLPRSNVYSEIARATGSLSWVTYADTAEFREEELTRYFLCYPPRLLIGNHDLLLSVQSLPPQCFLQLGHVVSIDEPIKIAQAKSYVWSATLTHGGVIQSVRGQDVE